MRVEIQVAIYDSDDYRWGDDTTKREVKVVASEDALGTISWASVCAGLVEGALSDAIGKSTMESPRVARLVGVAAQVQKVIEAGDSEEFIEVKYELRDVMELFEIGDARE